MIIVVLKNFVVCFIVILGFVCIGNFISGCFFICCFISRRIGIYEVNNNFFNYYNIWIVIINCFVYRMECIFIVYEYKLYNMSDI